MTTKYKPASDKVGAIHIAWKLGLYIFVNKKSKYALVLGKKPIRKVNYFLFFFLNLTYKDILFTGG